MYWKSFSFFIWPNAVVVQVEGNYSIRGPRGAFGKYTPSLNLCDQCLASSFFHCWFKFHWISVSCFQPLDFVIFSLNGRAILYLIHSILYLSSVINLRLIEWRQRILCISLFGTFWGLHLYLWLLFYPVWLCTVIIRLKFHLNHCIWCMLF